MFKKSKTFECDEIVKIGMLRVKSYHYKERRS